MSKKERTACPCGGPDYAGCCGRFIEQGIAAPTVLELMRSRYTAYTQDNDAYVRATWYPRTLPEGVLTAKEPNVKWVGLEVLRHSENGDEGTVEFIARYKIGGRAYKMHEASRFVREEGRWFYLDGQQK